MTFARADVVSDTPERAQERRGNGRVPVPVVERLMKRVVKVGDCWEWQGAVGTHRYGMIGLGSREDGVGLVHRVSYEAHHGPIPRGLHIDHLCNNRICVNPAHLEAVTKRENDRRRDERRSAR